MSHSIKNKPEQIYWLNMCRETHFLSYRRSTLAQSSKCSQKIVETDYIVPLGYSLFKNWPDIKTHFSTTNYFNQLWLSLSFTVAQVIDALKKTSLGTINIRSKKRSIMYKKTYFITPQASTSVWNNSRYVLVESDWMHMLACDIGIYINIPSPIRVNRSNFLLQLCQSTHDMSRHPEKCC